MGKDRTETRRYGGGQSRPAVTKLSKYPITALEKRVIDSAAFADLRPMSILVLLLFAHQLTLPNNNGHLQAAYGYCRKFGIGSEHTLTAAIADLIAHGFIYRTRSHGANGAWARYAVTWRPLATDRTGLFLDGFVSCAWHDWAPAGEKTSRQKVQEASGRKCSFKTNLPAESAGNHPAKSADYVLIANTEDRNEDSTTTADAPVRAVTDLQHPTVHPTEQPTSPTLKTAPEVLALWESAYHCHQATPLGERMGFVPVGARVTRQARELLIPLREPDGTLRNLRVIAQDGRESLAVPGSMAGLHAPMGIAEDGKPLVFVLDWFSGCVVHRAGKVSVIHVPDLASLPLVVAQFRRKFPSSQFLMAGAAGPRAGYEATLTAGKPMRLVQPDFSDGRTTGTWLDLKVDKKRWVVANQIAAAIQGGPRHV